jgi:hypothetical protein
MTAQNVRETPPPSDRAKKPFCLEAATIAELHAAIRAGEI